MDLREEKVQLEKAFNACNLERFGGIRVIWTSNLLDYLRLYDPSGDNEPHQLLLFHHVRLLEHLLESGIFPKGLVEETLQILSLLLPRYDIETAAWFKAQIQLMDYSVNPQAAHCKPLDLSQRSIACFSYWGVRLTIVN